MAKNRVLHKRSNVLLSDGTPKSPDKDIMEYGELAINYNAGNETIFLKNSNNEIVGITDSTKYYVTIYGDLSEHIADTNNPHKVTSSQVGLGSVDNTADLDKPLSNAQQAALDGKLGSDDIVTDDTFAESTVYVSTKALAANVGLTLYELLQEAAGGTIGDITELEQRVAALEDEVNGIIIYEKQIQDEEDCLFCNFIEGVEEYFSLSKLSDGTTCLTTETVDRDAYTCSE